MITLDGKEVTKEELNDKLEEATTNKSVKIVKISENEYKTLTKMYD